MGARFALAASVVFGVLAAATAVWAYFSTQGSGSSAASSATLAAPTNLTAAFPNPALRTVHITWQGSAAPGGGAVDGYYVQRLAGASATPACGSSPSSLLANTTMACDDTSAPSGTYTYSVTAVFRTWTATSVPSAPVTVPASALSSFSVGPATSSPTAGLSFMVTITARDQYGSIYQALTGAQCVTFSGPGASPNHTAPIYPAAAGCATGSSVVFSSGIATASVTLVDAQSSMLAVTANTSAISGVSGTITVNAGAAATFVLAAATSNPVAGVADNLSVTADDSYGNQATSYAGTKSLTFSGPHVIGAHTPTVTNASGTATSLGSATAISFVNGGATVNGAANGVMVLYKAETVSLTVSDGTISNGSGLTVAVGPANVSSLAFTTSPGPGPAAASANLGPLTVQEQDQFGNPTTTVETVNLTSNSSGTYLFSTTQGATGPTGPASVTIPAGRSAVSFYYGDTRAGAPTITAAASGLASAAQPQTITAASAAGLAFTTQPGGGMSGSTWAQQPVVTVRDVFGNTVTTSSAAITLAIGTQPGSGATLTCTTNPLTATTGLASFAGCTIAGTGGSYTLQATSGSLTSATSGLVAVTGRVTASLATRVTDTTSTHTSASTPSVTSVAGATYLILVERLDSKTNVTAAVSGPFTAAATQLRSTNFETGNPKYYLWAFWATGNGTTAAVTATFGSTGTNTATTVDVIRLSGNNTTSPIAQSATNGSGSGVPSSPAVATLTSPSALNGEVVFVGAALAAPTISLPTGFTQVDQQAGTGWSNGAFSTSIAQASASFTLSTAEPWATISIEVNHS